mgnify:CR=1 FL=1
MIRKYLLYAFAFTSLIFTSCMDSFLDRNPYGAKQLFIQKQNMRILVRWPAMRNCNA